MTLTAALNSARTGLATTQTQIAGSSDNISNALTEGYVARSSDAVARAVNGSGAGVSAEILRGPVNSRLLRDIRFSGSDLASVDIRSTYASQIVEASGTPEEGRSLTAALTQLNAAFQALSSSPDSPSSQRAVLDAAKTLANRFGEFESSISDARLAADTAIGEAVGSANTLLLKIENLNDDIIKAQASGSDGAAFLDERDRALNDLSQLIGIRTYLGEDGDVRITTKEGITLLDGTARQLSFSPVSQVPAGASLGTPLSGLYVDGTDITPTGSGAQALQSGEIAGAFIARDADLPRYQSQIDELARQTLALFQNADASVAAIGPPATGLFVELDAVSGLPIRHDELSPADPVPGLAGRIAVNTLVDPSVGGSLSRLRDGVQAGSAGLAGDTTQINAFLGALGTNQTFSATPGLATSTTLEGYAIALIDNHQTDLVTLSQEAESQQLIYSTLVSRHVGETGVNVDAESERLLSLEQAYAANAQVISTVNRMFDELLARLA